MENGKKNLVFYLGDGHHASFPQKPVVNLLKPLQNKKGQKNLRYPRKKQSFSKERDCFCVGQKNILVHMNILYGLWIKIQKHFIVPTSKCDIHFRSVFIRIGIFLQKQYHSIVYVIVTARNFLSKLVQAAQWFVNKFYASKN